MNRKTLLKRICLVGGFLLPLSLGCWILFCSFPTKTQENDIAIPQKTNTQYLLDDQRFHLIVRTAATQQEYYVTLAEAKALGCDYSKPQTPLSSEFYEQRAKKYVIKIDESRFLLDWRRSCYAGGDFRKYIKQAYQVAAICLQHQFSKKAIIDFISFPDLESQTQASYSLAGSQLLVFTFNESGELLSAQINGKHINSDGTIK